MTRPTSSSFGKPRRRRGAPPGNLNALKHGFYSRQLRQLGKAGLADAEDCDFSGLKDEITLLRIYIRRVIDLGQDVDFLPEAISILRVLCIASTTLNRLIKTQHLLAAGTDEVTTALRQVLDEFAQVYEGKLEESQQIDKPPTERPNDD